MLFGATACNTSAPAAVAHPWSDNSRGGNTTQSQSGGAVRRDRHCPLRNQVIYNLLKTQGFYKALIFLIFNEGNLVTVKLQRGRDLCSPQLL